MINIVCCVFVKDGRLLAVQRRANQNFPLKWSIPGGKVEQGETLAGAAARETMEELGVEAIFNVHYFALRIFEKYVLHYMRARQWSGEPRNLDGAAMRWLSREELDHFDWLPDDLVIAREVLT